MMRLAGGTIELGSEATLAIPPLEVYRAARAALTGASGTGKSSTLAFFRGVWEGKAPDLSAGDPTDGIVLVLQDPGLFPTHTVRMNVALGCWPRPVRKLATARTRAEATLESLGLSHLAGRGVGALSGGEQKRVALARGLSRGAPVLLVDEPTAGLDPDARLQVRMILASYAAEGNCVVVATHDDELVDAAHRVLSVGGTHAARRVENKGESAWQGA